MLKRYNINKVRWLDMLLAYVPYFRSDYEDEENYERKSSLSGIAIAAGLMQHAHRNGVFLYKI